MQDAPITELEARLSELSQERDHFRKLYLETLERCALLERGIIGGNKADRFTADGESWRRARDPVDGEDLRSSCVWSRRTCVAPVGSPAGGRGTGASRESAGARAQEARTPAATGESENQRKTLVASRRRRSP